MARIRLLVVAALLLVLVGNPAALWAQDSSLSWTVTAIYGESYRPGTWVPLRVAISNSGSDRRLEVRVSNFSTTLDVPGGGQKATILYVQLDQTTRVPVALYENGEKRDTATLSLSPTAEPLVATMLAQPLPQLRTHSLIPLLPADLPGTSTGLHMLAALALDEAAWNDLAPAQQAAIAQWVAGGGTLIAVGSATDSLPDTLQPATTAGSASFDGGVLASQIGYDQPADAIPGNVLRPTADSLTLLVNGGNPLLVVRTVGSGRVVATAMALDAPALVGWRGLDRFWATLVPQGNIAPWAGPFTTISSLRDGQVPTYLNNLPALDLPPLRTLLLLLAVYVVLVGPITHLVLRRLDRMAWAWITIPALTLVFAMLAYGFGARQRGSDILINELAIIQSDGANAATVHGYAGIFSPIKDEYAVQASPNTLLRPLMVNAGFGGPGAAQGAASALYSNDPAEIRQLAINQWSMEMFAFEYRLSDPPRVALDLTLEGERLRGTVRNLSAAPMSDAALIVGGQAQKFGLLAAGEERQIDMRMQSSFNQSAISYLLYQAELDAGYQSPRGPNRDLLARSQAIDTAVPTGYGPPSADPIFVAFVDQDLSILSLDQRRFSRSQKTLLVQQGQLDFGTGEVALDSRWMQLRSINVVQPAVGQADFCLTNRGNGMTITAATSQIEIQLPPQASRLQASELRFVPALDGITDPSKLTYELYNWSAGAWEPIVYQAGFLNPAVVEPYFSNGQIRLRYTMPEGIDNGGGWWGCFSPGLVVKGSLQ